jgi:hypothetical protein
MVASLRRFAGSRLGVMAISVALQPAGRGPTGERLRRLRDRFVALNMHDTAGT